jgi:hypothetical protein
MIRGTAGVLEVNLSLETAIISYYILVLLVEDKV